jgi:hypothetical protein
MIVFLLQIVHPRLCLGDCDILLADPSLLFKFDVLFMFLNEFCSYLLSIVKVPQFLQLLCLLVTFDLLLYKLNSIYRKISDQHNDTNSGRFIEFSDESPGLLRKLASD